jgi:hypothetical protein
LKSLDLEPLRECFEAGFKRPYEIVELKKKASERIFFRGERVSGRGSGLYVKNSHYVSFCFYWRPKGI